MNPTSSVRRVGFLGMGIMGSAMAANLLKAGFELTVFNRTADKCRPLAELGARVAASPADVVRAGVEVLCLCVTDTSDVEALLIGPGGAIEGLAPKPGPSGPDPASGNLLIIDHSTISPTATRHLARRLAHDGVTLLDAPVSGGDSGARNATLSIMVGGPTQAFERALPVLRAMGKTIVHLGDSGAGQACKACNQVAVACNLVGLCEAIALAGKLGLDPRKMLDVVSQGAAASWQMSNLGPKILDRDDRPGFRVEHILKDLAIVLEAARQPGSPDAPLTGTTAASPAASLPLHATAAAAQYFRQTANLGHRHHGTQSVYHAVAGEARP